MPDLVTHVSLAWLLRRPFEKRSGTLGQVWRMIFYLGVILPDILTRPWYILFPDTSDFTFTLHTPLGITLACVFLSLFFRLDIRTKAFFHLLAGSYLHLFTDLFQRHVGGGYYLLFPFSWSKFEFGLFWPDEIMTFIPAYLTGIGLLEFILYRMHKKRESDKPAIV